MAKQPAMRMNAYYFGFASTGVPNIDRILSAVANAGKAFHHTADWADKVGPRDGLVGESPIEWIQNAANEAAKASAKMHASTQIEGHGLIMAQHWDDDDDTYVPRCECGETPGQFMSDRKCNIWHLAHRREVWAMGGDTPDLSADTSAVPR